MTRTHAVQGVRRRHTRAPQSCVRTHHFRSVVVRVADDKPGHKPEPKPHPLHELVAALTTAVTHGFLVAGAACHRHAVVRGTPRRSAATLGPTHRVMFGESPASAPASAPPAMSPALLSAFPDAADVAGRDGSSATPSGGILARLERLGRARPSTGSDMTRSWKMVATRSTVVSSRCLRRHRRCGTTTRHGGHLPRVGDAARPPPHPRTSTAQCLCRCHPQRSARDPSRPPGRLRRRTAPCP